MPSAPTPPPRPCPSPAEPQAGAPRPPRRFGCLTVFLLLAATVVVTLVAAFLLFRAFLFPPAFRPVTLSPREDRALQSKLERLNPLPEAPPAAPAPADTGIDTAPYREDAPDRILRFTERELNALLAKNTDLAEKLFIDLAPGLVTASLRIPLDEDLPLFGGKVLRVKAGVEHRFEQGRPVLLLRGVKVMGVALPNHWLGGLKNIDLVRDHGGDAGFWRNFAEGVASLRIEEGALRLELRE